MMCQLQLMTPWQALTSLGLWLLQQLTLEVPMSSFFEVLLTPRLLEASIPD